MSKVPNDKPTRSRSDVVRKVPQSQKDPPKEKKILHRKKHKNSRLGCPQCRQRRIKCDETLPSCKKCISRAIRCGYLDLTPQELDAIEQAHIDAKDEAGNIKPSQKSAEYSTDLSSSPVQYPGADSHILHSEPAFPLMKRHTIIQHGVIPHPPISASVPQFSYNFPLQVTRPMPPPPLAVDLTIDQEQQQQQQQQQLQTSQLQALVNQIVPLSQLNIPYTPANNSIYYTHTHKSEDFIDAPYSEKTRLLGPTTTRQLIEEYIHPIHRFSHSYDSGIESPTSADYHHTNSSILITFATAGENKISPPNYNNLTRRFEVPLIPHRDNRPPYDLKKFPPHFNETVPGVFSRVFLLNDMFNILKEGMVSVDVFKAAIIFGAGKVLVKHPEALRRFLELRGDSINYLRRELSAIHDDNARQLLRITSLLHKSAIFFKHIELKDFFSFASGPCALLRAVYDEPERYPKSFSALKIFADGLLFTSKYIWLPQYDGKLLDEFYDVVKQFGEKYIENEDNYNTDDPIHHQYKSFVQFIKSAMELVESQKSPQFVSTYPVDGLFELVKRWYSIVPSEIYTLGSSLPPIERVFYVLWNTLVEILDVILVGTRYIFSFFLNGTISIHTFDKDQLMFELHDSELEWNLNYCSRIISFLVRRRAFVLRNTILNDPIPQFVNIKDRLRSRSLDIHERCITSFKNTVIKKINYPSKSSRSQNLDQDGKNYYKTLSVSATDEMLHDFDDLGTDGEDTDDVLRKYRINSNTSLLEIDYDPRFVDSIFNEKLNFQSADLEFIDRYIEDRRLIIQSADSYSKK